MTRRKALLVVLILAMGLFSVSTAGWLVNEIVTMWDVIFATGLTILSVITIADLWLGIFVVRKLNKRLGYEKFIWERVGVLPHQLPAWKWKAVALPRAEELLSGCAVEIQKLCQEEEQLLVSPQPDAVHVLDLNKEISRRKAEFWGIREAFTYCGLEFTKKSWKEYEPWHHQVAKIK